MDDYFSPNKKNFRWTAVVGAHSQAIGSYFDRMGHAETGFSLHF